LPRSDFIIGGVIAQIYDGRQRSLGEFNQQFKGTWNLRKIEALVGGFHEVSVNHPNFAPAKSS
jgi:hypothetical protein